MEEVTESPSVANTSEDIGSELKRVDATETKNEGGKGIAEEEDEGEPSSDLHHLMQHLEAKIDASAPEVGQSLGSISVEVVGNYTRIEYSLFDAADKLYTSGEECWVMLKAKAKLRLLQAIGRCRTLRRIFVKDLTGNELEALLTPMQSSPVLNWITIRCPDETASAERIYEIMGRILQTSRTLTGLALYLEGVTGAGACHLASGVRGNAESALEMLRVGDWKESSVAIQVAEIVQSASRLRELHVARRWVTIEGDGIDALASAIAQSTSLQLLHIHGVVRGAPEMLRKALTGDGSNKSIARLELTGVMEGLRAFLPILLAANQSLQELTWDSRWARLSPSQGRSVAESLNSTSSLQLFKILVNWSVFHADTIDGRVPLLTLLSTLGFKNSCVTLFVTDGFTVGSKWLAEDSKELLGEFTYKKNPIIELHLFEEDLNDVTTMWASLAEALNSKDTNLSSLYLRTGRKMERAEGREVDSFFQALQKNSTLRHLTVERDSGERWPDGWMKLIDSLRYNITISHLRLIDCKGLDDVIFKQFMGVL